MESLLNSAFGKGYADINEVRRAEIRTSEHGPKISARKCLKTFFSKNFHLIDGSISQCPVSR